MESPLKERLTGALIVVAVLVIVVPEMLSGPGKSAADAKPADEGGPPVRTYSLELGTPAANRTQDQSALTPQSSESAPASKPVAPAAPVASASAAAPAPTTSPPPSTAAPPASAPVVATVVAPPTAAPSPQVVASAEAKPAPHEVKPAPQEKPSPQEKPTAAKDQWWTQLGSFSARDNAERLARDLRAKGYSINVARIKVGAKDLYRVRAGPVAGREAAVALQTRLAAAGHKSSLVAP